MNVHPETGRSFVATAVLAGELPGLLEAMERGELTERHVRAVLEALPVTVALPVREQVLRAVLHRCRVQAERGRDWPTPGGLRRLLTRELLVHDPDAAAERGKAARDRRGVAVSPLPDGQALLSLEGPAPEVAAMAEALRARAKAQPRVEGDTRSASAREFDLAVALLTGHGDGQPAAGRGPEVMVLVPFSTATGGELEPADLVGYGPVLPATARDLLARADVLRRVCLDAGTGRVLAVDDAVRIADGEHRQALIAQAVAAMASTPVQVRDLSTTAYRPSMRLVRQIRLRDRTCTFPGCTRPATGTDLDHRVPWPTGPTDEANLHCLCRHHHRAKQARFTVTRHDDGSTTWTSSTGRTYRRPPPDLL
jgi:hypothetical protein